MPTKSTTLTIHEVPEGASYVLVFDDRGSRRVPLPSAGVAVIGRTDECEIQIDDSSASRTHARLEIGEAGVSIVDLGSRHGTRLNGQLTLSSPSPLASGDVLQVGRSSLVVHLATRQPRNVAALARAELDDRLERELQRARRHRRSLAIVLLDLAGGSERLALERAQEHLRGDDTIGVLEEGKLLVVAPETSPAEAERRRNALAAALAQALPNLRAVVACHPSDGPDAGGMLAAARARLAGANERRSVGDRSVIVADPAMAKTYDMIERLATSDIAVFIVGETGTGKELAASALHAWSPRSSGPLVAINCAALPETLIESELFGHEKGAFSGAERTKPGLMERATGGTLFLDELAELPPSAQSKLLRALEQRELLRIGGLEPIPVDFRLIAATSRDVRAEIAAGRLREDLYYRVAAAVLELPPLRDRPRDVAVLARTFLANARARAGRGPSELSDDALRVLSAYRFPGNVRELANAIDFACATTTDDVVEPWHLPSAITLQTAPSTGASERGFKPIAEEIAELERRRMLEALEAASGNQSRAAELIGMPRRTFVTKSAQYGLRRFGSEQ